MKMTISIMFCFSLSLAKRNECLCLHFEAALSQPCASLWFLVLFHAVSLLVLENMKLCHVLPLCSMSAFAFILRLHGPALGWWVRHLHHNIDSTWPENSPRPLQLLEPASTSPTRNTFRCSSRCWRKVRHRVL